MRMEHLSRSFLVAGILSIAIGGCGKSGKTAPGAGGTTSSGGGSGGEAAVGGGGSGGSTTTATTTSGGTSGGGGTTSQPATGGTTGSGGTMASGGGAGTGGAAGGPGGSTGTGGRSGGTGGSNPGTGGVTGSGGTVGTGGLTAATGGAATGGATGVGGRTTSSTGGNGGGGSTGTAGITGTGGTTSGTGGSTVSGTCTPSKAASANASGSGPHKVTVETNSDPGINEGTIYRPADLGGAEKYPIFVWGEGACSLNGLANSTAMAEIASHGYFVVADGTPNGSGNRTMDRSQLAAMAAPLLAYIDWAIAENGKPCSAYYQSLDTTKISSNGFSCGGLMSQATVMDPRIVTWGVTSSGMAGATQDFYDMIHTPVLFVEGGPSDMAYDGGKEGYQNISKLDVPVMWFSKELGHGGDLTRAGGGDFTKINLAWLNWWLKGDETPTGKGLLVGAGCSYCSDSAWEVMSAKVP
jgi:hypothetical protein